MRYFKNGGLHFFRIGRLQLSFCICKPKAWVMPEIIDLNQLPHRFQQLQRTLQMAWGQR